MSPTRDKRFRIGIASGHHFIADLFATPAHASAAVIYKATPLNTYPLADLQYACRCALWFGEGDVSGKSLTATQ